MKSIFNLPLVLMLATVLAVPNESAAQTVCQGFSTILKAMKQYRTKEKLEFYTLPGATCEISGDTYSCLWSRPRPHKSAGGAAYRQWHEKVSGEMKRLAGEFQQCIDKKQIPYKWASFKKHKKNGLIRRYYILTNRHPRMSVALCIRFADFLLPENQWHTSAALGLSVHSGHKEDCYFR